MKGIARVTDKTSTHTCGGTLHEFTLIVQGSDNVFLNDKNISREGDLVICEDVLGVGSNSVYINGKSVSRLNDKTTSHEGACTESRIITASDNCFVG
jgi:uncharacterized Zn-binding protein involved in type VI secretion